MTRGFEDLVREETLLPATQGPLTPAQELQRVDTLENRVRVTMDRLTELVEAQLPETVDGLRSDFEQLRTELRQALVEASAALAEERFQLRSQIATTVGAANRWFVRTRDQLFERLDEVAGVAKAAQTEAEAAAAAAVAAAVPIPVSEPEAEAAPPEPEPYAETAVPEGNAELEWGAGEPAGADGVAGGEFEEVAAEVQEGELAAGYDFELEPEPAPLTPATVSLALESPELDALLAPLREDMRELQGEISAMGAAVMALREDVEALGSRLPTRTASPRLAASQINAIVDAVQAALPATPAARRSTTRTASASSRATGATRATKVAKVRKAAKGTTAQRAAGTVRAASKRASSTVSRRRTP